jgi:hypothetical protein
MTTVVPKFQYFRLYVTEKDLFAGLELDDICILGTPEFPTVMSSKPDSIDQVVSPNSEDDDNNYGDDFVDSDNEFDKDDDDL